MSDTPVRDTPASDTPASDRVRLRRAYERGHYDAATLHAILDATPLCHIGYLKQDQPFVTPTLHWRVEDRVYWHGSSASQMLRAVADKPVCLTVSLLDGVVLARSGFHHSVNYRSAMVLGEAREVPPDERVARLEDFFTAWLPGRWQTLRPINEQELKATAMLSLPLDEASAKVRTGPPEDDEADYALPIWAGVLPIRQRAEPSRIVPCPRLSEGGRTSMTQEVERMLAHFAARLTDRHGL